MLAILDGSYWNQRSQKLKLFTLRDIGKIPHSNDKLIAKGIQVILSNIFNTFVRMVLAFLWFRLLITSWISSGSAVVRKMFDFRRLVRKTEKCLLVLTFFLIFVTMVEKNVLKGLLIRNWSISSVPCTMRQVTFSFSLLFIFTLFFSL